MKIHQPSTFNIIKHESGVSMMSREDYLRVSSACKIVGEDLILPPQMVTGGYTINGKDYLPIFMMEDPETIKNALICVCDYFGIKVVEE